ncbi:unnamed protein product [Prorocentrum cordatum]|nr:unnamed protein product [Polarella glacialis]
MWEVVRALRDANCDDFTENMQHLHEGRTPWHDLATPLMEGYSEVKDDCVQMDWAERLKSKRMGGMAFRTDGDGRFPLHWCAVHNYHRLAELLLQVEKEDTAAEAGINVQDVSGWTPCALACYHGHADTLKVLLGSERDAHLVVKGRQQSDTTRSRRYWRYFQTVVGMRPALSVVAEWPPSAFHVALLQIHEGTTKSGCVSSDVVKMALDMIEVMAEKEEARWYREKFLIRFIVRRVVVFLVAFGLVYLNVKQLFVGGPGFLIKSYDWSASIDMDRFFEDMIFTEELSDDHGTFYDMVDLDLFWTFSAVMEGVLYPPDAEEQPGMITPYTYLLGPVRMERRSFEVSGNCNDQIPNEFQDFGWQKTCILGQSAWAAASDTVDLPSRDRNAALSSLVALRADGWLDNSASAVRVHFAAYNTQLGMVYTCTLSVAFTETGRVRPSKVSQIFRWAPLDTLWNENWDVGLLLLFLILYTAAYVMEEIGQARTLRKNYLRDRGNLFDLLLGVLLVVMCIKLVAMLGLEMGLRAGLQEDEFVNFGIVSEVGRNAQFVCGSALLVLTLRFMKLLRLLPHIGPQIQAVAKTLVDMKVILFLLFVMFLVFGVGVAMNACFGSSALSYESVLPAAFNMMYRFLYGDWDADELTEDYTIWGTIFFLLLAFMLTGTLSNIFIAVVSQVFEKHSENSIQTWKKEVNKQMAIWYGKAASLENPIFK